MKYCVRLMGMTQGHRDAEAQRRRGTKAQRH